MMKKYLDGSTSIEDLKDMLLGIQKKEDKKAFYFFIALVGVALVAATIGVVIMLKNKMDSDYDEDWDCDWDEFDEDEFDGECKCTDKDVDNSVKVEQI